MEPKSWKTQRSEATRKASRWAFLLALILWLVNLFTTDQHTFGESLAPVVRMPMVLACIAGVLWTLRPRPRAALERLLVGTWIAQIAWLFPHLIELPPEVIYPFVGSLTVGSVVVALACAFSTAATAVFTLVFWGAGLAALLLGGLGPTDHPIHLIVVTAVIVAARRRDQLARSEFEAQQDLALARAQLEHQVAVRADLFLALSHDIRTPLALVRAEAEALANGRDAEEAAALGRIMARCDALAGFADQALALARLELDRTVARPSAVSLETVAREVVALHAPHGGREVEVSCQGSSLAHVDADHARSIVSNLVSNALRHAQTADGAPVVKLTIREVGERVVIEVANNGRPIEAAMRARLFERFASLREGAGLGSGLGLALSRELARLGGGDIELVSSEDWTVFRAWLPRAKEAPTQAPVLSPVRAEPVGGASILLVEDEPHLATLVAARLGERHDVRVCHDLASALRELERIPPDLVITDLLLPDGRGERLIERASALVGPPTPVIVVSAIADSQLRTSVLRDGVDDFLVKPFSVDELAARVDGALARADRARGRLVAQRREVQGELHDGVASGLTRALALLDELRAGGADSARLERVAAVLQSSLDECRALLNHLADRPVPTIDFAADLRRELADTCEQHALDLDWRIEIAGERAQLDPPTAHTLKRAAHEALTNTIRHARAERVSVGLTLTATATQLTVEDDGVGFGQVSEGVGLGAMRRRVEGLGGRVSLRAAHNTRTRPGTRVEIDLSQSSASSPA